jgi:hypothetical protein
VFNFSHLNAKNSLKLKGKTSKLRLLHLKLVAISLLKSFALLPVIKIFSIHSL